MTSPLRDQLSQDLHNAVVRLRVGELIAEGKQVRLR